jgi:type IX secretion system PorP/SprF family membrane protein
MKMKSLFVFQTLILISMHSAAQDPIYSVYWNDRTYLNPARCGEDKGLYIASHYRKQWPGIISNFDTYSASADVFEPNVGGGLGVRVLKNEEGEGIQKTNEFTLNYSVKVPMSINGARAEASVGVGAGIITRVIDATQLVFSDQLDPVNGVVYPTGANVGGIEKAKASNFSVGVSLRSHFTKMRTDTYWHLGFAVHNANQPNLSLVNQEARLPLRYVAYVDAIGNLRPGSVNAPFYLKPAFVYMQQKGQSGKTFESFRIGTGMMTRRIMTAVYYKNESIYDLRTNESLIYVVGTTFINTRPIINVYYSYDMTISELATNTKGVHEIGISVLFEGNRIFKLDTGPGRKLRNNCPEFGFTPNWM